MAYPKLKIHKDQMTPIERMEAFSKGEDLDRIPCSLDGGETMAYLINTNISEYYHSAEKMLELEEYMYYNFKPDGVGVSITLRGMAEAMGTEILYPENNIAQVKKNAIDSLDQVDRLGLVDLDKDGRLPIILKGLDLVNKKLGDKVPVSGTVTGPFTIAAMVLGTEKLMKGMIKEPEKVKLLMEIIVENNNRYIDRMAEIGVGFGFADPVSSTSLISKKMYEEFSYPYFKRNVDHIKSLGSGCGLHICGKSKEIWDVFLDSGIGTFSLDNVEDMGEAKELIGHKLCIMGNVPPVDVMRNGGPEDVIRAAKDCIRKSYDSPNGFILTSGCQMPIYTPEENMQALMDASRIYGAYPLNEDLLLNNDEEWD